MKIQDPESGVLGLRKEIAKNQEKNLTITESLAKRIKAKAEKYKAQGYAEKDYESVIRGKRVKMWLPNNVMEQQKLLLLSGKIFLSNPNESTVDDFADITNKYYAQVCAHLLIEGKETNPQVLELAELQGYGVLYYAELLYPLSLWGDIVAQEMLA